MSAQLFNQVQTRCLLDVDQAPENHKLNNRDIIKPNHLMANVELYLERSREINYQFC